MADKKLVATTVSSCEKGMKKREDALRPLTLCNCDFEILTSAVCRGLHWYTTRCIHPSHRCISSRQMTDNIFEIETTALAHVACAAKESGILLTDFAAAYPSVTHSWILSVLEKTELPDFICHFLRKNYRNSTTHVEFAGATRKQFRMARGVRQGCPASSFLFTMAFDPIFRWLQETVFPRNPFDLDFLQPAQCAYADDFAVAPSSFRDVMTALAPAFHSVNHIAGLNLSCRKCCWVHNGNEEREALCQWVYKNCREFREMQIVRYAKYVGTMIGPDGYIHRWTAPGKKFIQRVLKINTLTKSLVERLCEIKIYAISVLSFISSVCAPDKATLKAENHVLQCTTAGPYNAIPSNLLGVGSVCGLGPDLVGIHSLSLAARYRVAACSTTLRQGLQTIQTARGHHCAPMFAISPAWEKEFLAPSMSWSIMSAFDLVCQLDCAGKLGTAPQKQKQKIATGLLCRKFFAQDFAGPISARAYRILDRSVDIALRTFYHT